MATIKSIKKKNLEAAKKTKKFFKADVAKSTKEDVQKRFKPKLKGTKGAARSSVKAAAKKAGARLLGRAGVLGAAAKGGFAIGTAIEKKTGIGKKIGGALFKADQKLKSFSKAQSKANKERMNRKKKGTK